MTKKIPFPNRSLSHCTLEGTHEWMANGHSESCQMPLINAPMWQCWALWQAWFNLLFGNQPHLWTFCSSYKSKSYCWSFGAEHFQNVSLNNHKLLFSPLKEVNISWLSERTDYVSWTQQCVLCLTESCCTPSSPPKPLCNLHVGSCSLGAVDNNVIHPGPDSDLITGMTYPPIKGQCYFRWLLFSDLQPSTIQYSKNPKPTSSVCNIYRITSSPTLSSELRQIIHLIKEGITHFGHFRMCTFKNFQIFRIYIKTRSEDKAVIYNISDCNPEAKKTDAFKGWKENSQRKCII